MLISYWCLVPFLESFKVFTVLWALFSLRVQPICNTRINLCRRRVVYGWQTLICRNYIKYVEFWSKLYRAICINGSQAWICLVKVTMSKMYLVLDKIPWYKLPFVINVGAVLTIFMQKMLRVIPIFHWLSHR